MPRSRDILAFVAVAGLLAVALTAQVARPNSRRHVQAPATWVPFSATLNQKRPNGVPAFGRFFRNTDGSERSEVNLYVKDLNTTLSTINIKNIPESTFYLYRSQAGWTQHPMVLPPNGWQPQGRLESPKYTRGVEKVAGFEVYRAESESGLSVLEAPELNFFHLVREFGPDDTEWYTDVAIGEPDIALFRPPEGVHVEVSTTPAGIVTKFPGRR